MEKDGIAEKP